MKILQIRIHQEMSDLACQDPQRKFLPTGSGGRTNKLKSLFAVALDGFTKTILQQQSI